MTVVVYRVGGQAYGLPLEHVVETMRALPAAELARPPESVLGVAIIRGAPTPVVDAGKLFGQRPTTAGRYVTVRVGARTIALAVDEVVGVRALTDDTTHAVPPVLDPAASALERLGMLDGELIAVLRAARLVSEEVLATLEAPR